ncbi:MAG: hypothetical protein AAF682_31115 [Planctomycetota bacterium]
MALPEITALCRVLGRSDPHDVPEQSRNLARIQELQSYLEPYAEPGINACLEAAAAMVELLASKGVPDRDVVLQTVCRTMAAVEKHWQGPDPDSVIAEHLGSVAAPGPEAPEQAPPEAAHEVFVQHDPEQIDANQRKLEEIKATPRINEMVLGELLIELGHVTPAQIRECLDMQGDTGYLLGQILVEEGIVTEKLIEETARLQRQLRNTSTAESVAELVEPVPAGAPAEPESSELEDASELRLNFVHKPTERTPPANFAPAQETLLGQIMVSKGMVAQEKLDLALKVQRASGLRVGEALVDIGATNWDAVEQAVELQGRLRKAAGLIPRSLSL